MGDEDLYDRIRGFEGYTARAKWDYAQNSNGYGTKARYPGEIIPRQVAEQRMRDEVGGARGIVDKFAPNADAGTRDALTDLTFNAGKKWTQEGLGKAVLARDYPRAQELFGQYVNAGGKPLAGLVERRAAMAPMIGAVPRPAVEQPADGMDAASYGAARSPPFVADPATAVAKRQPPPGDGGLGAAILAAQQPPAAPTAAQKPPASPFAAAVPQSHESAGIDGRVADATSRAWWNKKRQPVKPLGVA